MKVTAIALEAAVPQPLKIALVTDTHNRFSAALRCALSESQPDGIAISGDLISREDTLRSDPAALDFLRFCAKTAPTFYSLGNHEALFSGADLCAVKETGVLLLEDDAVCFRGVWIGGLSSGIRRKVLSGGAAVPNLEWLQQFAAQPGFRILLCHHPEYYERYIRQTSIDLTLSGHAHGGQICVAGRGLFAPGQGIFPAFTSGVFENRLVISRGLCNTVWPIPRLGNPTELVLLRLCPQEEQKK